MCVCAGVCVAGPDEGEEKERTKLDKKKKRKLTKKVRRCVNVVKCQAPPDE